jgi:cysteine dioxygenase
VISYYIKGADFMDFHSKVKHIFDPLVKPTSKELKVAMEQLDVKMDDVHPYLADPHTFPYGRKLVYKSEHVEALVMNWNDRIECSPHDHGDSYGWVAVVGGKTTHKLYKIDPETEMPIIHKVEITKEPFFAHKKQIHSMVNNEEEPLVTFHVYAPPIQGMKVYDLERCAACIVSDDCGAWWPEEQRQLVNEIKIGNYS